PPWCRNKNAELTGAPLHIHCVQAFGPLLTLEHHSLALIQGLKARVLDRREVDKHVLARRTLNKTIPLGPIEPLHNTSLFHLIPSASYQSGLLTFSASKTRH